MWSMIIAASLSALAACVSFWDYKGHPMFSIRIEMENKLSGRKRVWQCGDWTDSTLLKTDKDPKP